MNADVRFFWDATGASLAGGLVAPSGVGMMLYVTGSDGVPATAAELAKYPAAVRIDQSPVLTAIDETADLLDFENGAAQLATLAPWYQAAARNYVANVRPGQRRPAIYCSYANRTAVANELSAGGVKSGPGLFLADWDAPVETIIDALVTSGGTYPVIGVQVHNAGTHDVSMVRADWADTVSSPFPLRQNGWVVSTTTGGARRVTSTDHGVTFR